MTSPGVMSGGKPSPVATEPTIGPPGIGVTKLVEEEVVAGLPVGPE